MRAMQGPNGTGSEGEKKLIEQNDMGKRFALGLEYLYEISS
jgi:hypothetical protein